MRETWPFCHGCRLYMWEYEGSHRYGLAIGNVLYAVQVILRLQTDLSYPSCTLYLLTSRLDVITTLPRNNDTVAAFFLTRIPTGKQFGRLVFVNFAFLWSKALYTALLSLCTTFKSCTSSWSIVDQSRLNLAELCLWDFGWMKYISFKVFGYDILRHLITKATFHISSIRHCVVMINMRSRKAGNGLKRWKRRKRRVPIWFSRLGICVTKKAAVSLFLKQL